MTNSTMKHLILTASTAALLAFAPVAGAQDAAAPPIETKPIEVMAAPAPAADVPAAPAVETPAPAAAEAPAEVEVKPEAKADPAPAETTMPEAAKMEEAEKPVEKKVEALPEKDVGEPVAMAPVEPVEIEKTAPRKTIESLGPKMTLKDVVAIGMETNPEYGVVANNRRATDEELRQAKGLYMPSLDMRADTGYEYSDDPGTRARGDEESMWRYDAGLTLTQMLFDGWETKYENDRQKARVLSASNRVREASELIGLGIIEAYLEVMRQRELLTIARENVAQHISLTGQIDDSAEAGRTTNADVVQAKARLAAARATESSVREALRQAEASFIREVGDAPQDLTMPVVPVDGLAADLEQEVKLALHQSPTLDIFESDIKVANAEFEGAKSTFFPQVDLQLNGRQGHDLGGVEGRDTSATALMVLNWNLYRGGIDSARVREHIGREAQAKEARAEAARNVESDVRQTWARMISAGERAKEFAAQAEANGEVVKSYKDQFDLNRRTLLDVLDSQNELFVSRSNTINAEFLEMFAVYRLLALKGELLNTLQIAPPREADPSKM